MNFPFCRFASALAVVTVIGLHAADSAEPKSIPATLIKPMPAQPAPAMKAYQADGITVQQFNEARMLGLSVRIGMATGPAVAGIVGTQRFSYDLWGRTMNVAAGLESQGTPGMIKVSGATCLKLSHLYDLHPCDPVDLPGIGSVEAWHLEGV